MDRYVGGEEIDEDVLVADLERAVARASFHPVVPVCSMTGIGCTELLDLADARFPVARRAPSPRSTCPGAAADPITCDPDGLLVAEVVKTTSDPYVGAQPGPRLLGDPRGGPAGASRATSPPSSARPPARDHDEDEKVGALSYPSAGCRARPAGRGRRPSAIGRLTRAETGDTLSSVGEGTAGAAALVDARAVAARGDRGAEQGRRRQAVPGAGRLAAEDPSLRIENNPRPTSWCCGRWASRTPTSPSSGWPSGTPSTSTRSPSWCRSARPSPARPPRRAGT